MKPMQDVNGMCSNAVFPCHHYQNMICIYLLNYVFFITYMCFFQHVPPNPDVAPHLQSSIVMIVIIIIVIIIIMCNYMFKTFSGLFSYIDITSHMPISQKSITCAIHGAFWSQQKCLSASVSQLSIAQVDVVSLFDSLPIDWSGWFVGYEDTLRDAAWPSKLLVMLPCRKLIVKGHPSF